MLVSILLALSSFSAQQKPDVEAQVLARINLHRKQAGLEPVNLDPEISKGCSLHAQYLAKNSNHPSTKGLNQKTIELSARGDALSGTNRGI